MAGRKPLPTAVKIALGNPGKRALNKQEPTAPASKLSPPPHVKADKVAAKEYKRLGKLLLAAGVLTVLDENALAIYALEFSRWVRAEAQLAKDGDTLETDRGYRYAHPSLGVANKAKDTMMRILTEFGMTPSARSRIKAMPQSGQAMKGLAERLIPELEAAEIEKEAAEWEPPAATVTG
jgi:P27 family predicted phage terminase small subunit